ncbi:acetolactate decarboxylase [Hymenobacter terrenus]|uniref:acetolactate decarboxylase n=1 Tax=Hymenobacter terrenus TaxID=1629124 RepID=UPI00069863CF|nr:acetolactate decarboxylase [Hymenobacter terrenus]
MKALFNSCWGWGGLVVGLTSVLGQAKCNPAAPPAAPPAATHAPAAPAGRLFHFSLLDAFLAGTFDGDFSVGQLRRHGDFGLGAFNHNDGEMVVLDGRVYQVKADGRAYPASDTLHTPFACVNFFRPTRRLAVRAPLPQAALQRYLDSALVPGNRLLALKITGTFVRLRARSNPPVRQRPYPPLARLIGQQHVFAFDTVRGTFVGYRLPAYLKGVNLPGYHFHLLTADRQHGGHVLAYTLLRGEVEIALLTSYSVQLPRHPDFYRARLDQDRSQEVKKVE